MDRMLLPAKASLIVCPVCRVVVMLLIPARELGLPLVSMVIPFPISFSLVLTPVANSPISSIADPFVFLIIYYYTTIISGVYFKSEVVLFSGVLCPVFIPTGG